MTDRNRKSRWLAAAAALAMAAGWAAGARATVASTQVPVQSAGQPGPQRGQPIAPATGTGFISGQVVETPGGAGVAGAIVSLFGRGGRPPVATDSQGRFFFANLPAGDWSVQASLPGYTIANAAMLRPVPLADGDRVTDLKVRMYKLSSLSGAVRDDGGDPVVGMDVRLFRRTMANGKRALSNFGATKTDDRGFYHFANIQPAEYYICACSTDPIPFDGVLLATLASDPLQMMGVAARALTSGADVASIDKTLRTYAPAFHPSSATIARATAIKIGPSDDRTGIDIEVPMVRAARISGTISGATWPLDANSILLTPLGEGTETTNLSILQPMLVQPDGRFDFVGVPPGPYTLRVLSSVRQGAPPAPSGAALQFLGPRANQPPAIPSGGGMGGFADPNANTPAPMWAIEPITVGEEGLTGLSIQLRRASAITGRVEFVGSGPQPTQRGVVFMPPVDPATPAVSAALIGADGTFRIPGVVPGRYSFISNGAPRWPTLRSVIVNGADVTDLPFVVEGTDIDGIVVTYTDAPMGSITGTLTGATAAEPNTTVLAFPSDRRYWADPAASSRRYRTALVGRNNTYSFPALPAGEYLIVAVPDDSALDWVDPAKLQEFAKTAQRIQLADGDKKSLDVKR